jgi:hypothetical protein
MDSSFTFRSKVSLAVLSISIACSVLSFLALNSLNVNLVHSQLYSYGLTFSSQWATPYWQTLNFAFTAIAATAFFAVLALSTFVVAQKKGSSRLQRLSATFSLLTLIASVCSLAFFGFLGELVNGELYSFGLQFSSGWFNTYQLYFAGYIVLQAAVLVLSVASFSMAYLGNKQPIKKISLQKIVFPTLLVAGCLLIGYALFYDVTVALFGGFVLVFWGSIMLFVSGTHLVRQDVLDATSLTYWSHLDKIVNYQGTQSMVYTTQDRHDAIQTYPNHPIQQIQNVELTFGKPEHVNLAPENELFDLFERTLGKSFSGLSFTKFQIVLPKLLVENLELAHNVTVEANGDMVRVIVENPYDLQVYLRAKHHNRLMDIVGFPLSGAIAYALASSAGKPVIINRHLISLDKKSVEFEYTLLGQRSEAT